MKISLPLFPLFLIFLILKLAGVINWSWWIVTLPLWGGMCLFVSLFILAMIIAVLTSLSK